MRTTNTELLAMALVRRGWEVSGMEFLTEWMPWLDKRYHEVGWGGIATELGMTRSRLYELMADELERQSAANEYGGGM
jgi:hypothetical protein